MCTQHVERAACWEGGRNTPTWQDLAGDSHRAIATNDKPLMPTAGVEPTLRPITHGEGSRGVDIGAGQ